MEHLKNFDLKKSVLLGLFLLSMITGTSVRAQRPQAIGSGSVFMKNYTIDDGLPSSETYCVLQDKKGFIWIGTDRGVVRYDGYRMEVYTTEQGLEDNRVFQIVEDKSGRVWFVTARQTLCYYQNGKIHPYEFNEVILSNNGKENLVEKQLYVSDSGDVYLHFWLKDPLKISKDGKLLPSGSDKRKGLEITRVNQTYLWNYTSSDLKSTNSASIFYGRYKRVHDLSNGRTKVCVSQGNPAFVSFYNTIYRLPELRPVLETNNTVCLYNDSLLKGLWVGSIQDGIDLYDYNANNLVFKKHYLVGMSVTGVIRDKQGGTWFTTLERGVFYAPDISIVNFSEDDGLLHNAVASVASNSRTVFLGYERLHLQTFGRSGYALDSFYGAARTIFVEDRARDDVYTNVSIPKNSVLSGKGLKEADVTFYPTLLPGDSLIYYTEGDTRTFNIHSKKTGQFNDWVKEARFVHTDGKTVYLGDSKGIYILKGARVVPFHPQPWFKAPVTKQMYNAFWGNVVSTSNTGIYFWKDNTYKLLTTADGLASNDIRHFYVDSKNRLWVTSTNGVDRITKVGNGEFRVENINRYRGLASNEINGITEQNGLMYLATKQGLSVFEASIKISENTNRLFLYKVETDSVLTNYKFPLQLPYGVNQISFHFGTTDFRRINDRQIRYKFRSGQSWEYVNDNNITFISPASGDYELTIQSLDSSGKWVTFDMPVSFSVDIPFYRKWYAWIFYALALTGIFFLFYRWRIKALKRKNQIESHLVELERKALQAQMNPHFIFNSLNSIQSFLVFNENEKAERYLLKFSHLVRRILNNSVSEEIPIAEEIQTLEEYLELEKMRFRSRFDFHFELKLNEEQLRQKIPGMLLQPFVENAVIHGFKGFESGGKLEIRFEMISSTALRCTIRDNGQGLQTQHKKSKHISHGIRITRERLKSYSTPANTYYADIRNNTDGPGTYVEIVLPVVG